MAGTTCVTFDLKLDTTTVIVPDMDTSVSKCGDYIEDLLTVLIQSMAYDFDITKSAAQHFIYREAPGHITASVYLPDTIHLKSYMGQAHLSMANLMVGRLPFSVAFMMESSLVADNRGK